MILKTLFMHFRFGFLLALIVMVTAACSDSEKAEVSVHAPPVSEEWFHAICGADQTAEAWGAILNESGIETPKLLEIRARYIQSIVSMDQDRVLLSVHMLSDDAKSILEYVYDFREMKVLEPHDVTAAYDAIDRNGIPNTSALLEHQVFDQSDVLSFELLDTLFERALHTSQYGTDCYVSSFKMCKSFRGELKQSLVVQSTRSITAHKTIFFDETGSILK